MQKLHKTRKKYIIVTIRKGDSMATKKEILKQLKQDLKDGTSYSVDFLLKETVEETISDKGIKVRKVFAPLLRAVYLSQSKYKLVKDNSPKKIKTSTGKIFVVNHRQADDIVLGVNAIGEDGYIVFGNKDLVLETTNGLGLWAYGMILLNRDNKDNRHSTYEKMKYVLEHGGNVIIYPEGYWNLADNGLADERHASDGHNSENWLIQDINIGAVRLAQELGCPIIPTILHYDETKGKKCYSEKGEPFYVGKDEDIFAKKDELVQRMTTMYWMLMEKYSRYSRKELEADGIPLREKWEALKKELIADCDIPRVNYKLDLENEKLIGKAKVAHPVVTNEEAFEHLDHLIPSKENAFLLRKRLPGRK